MTDDERFEQWVREASVDYEAPRGEVPREAMWNAIRERRGAAALSMHAAPAPRRPHIRGWMGMAAMLLLGVAVGRFAWQRSGAGDTTQSPASPVAAATPAPTTVTADVPPSSTAPRPLPVRAEDGVRLDARSNTYAEATTRHLERVEVLLTSVAASPAEAHTDSLVARWAKDLLSNTRLLLDSPAARDPARARLLQDLEVILVQLVQRSPGGDADERATLNRTLDKTQLIPRLRSAVPASLHSGTD